MAIDLDDLLSRLDPKRKDEPVTAKRRYYVMRRAADRLCSRIRDLVDELH